MFKTDELNQILQIFMQRLPSQNIQQQLSHQYVNLEATILRAKILRNLSPAHSVYIIQSSIEWNDLNLAYLFSPIILANLNKKTIYTTPLTVAINYMLESYYQIQTKSLVNIDNTLENLNLYLDIFEYIDDVDFLFLSLIKAICHTDISKIFIISKLDIDVQILNKISQFLNIEIYILNKTCNISIFSIQQIDQKKLFFKVKDEFHRTLCHDFSKINAKLLMLTHGFNQEQAHHLIEDMFYSEHLFEKLSVYSEYIQTQIQNENILKPSRYSSSSF
ncbi:MULTISPECIES: hypothetical protein [unclassified Acinetobacter]|uniref:hypothetical protein n=1 Tax=unclassified Acinetobacter TaxID=196816 RepID=UPI00190BA22D|nr:MULTISPECIES: hypothetical protein [unclassified Acinetobacter]MBK0064954.1 hypothetical protein [Acinetobacter sp. S55]MBK0067355.1 hypothetical protein [Acinetobacter sp. S54]